MEDIEQAKINTGNISTRDVKGSALLTGYDNTQTVTYTEASPAGDDQAAVLEALRNIRTALEGISGPYSQPAKRNADAAIKAQAKLDKSEVGGALESALEAAKKAWSSSALRPNSAHILKQHCLARGGMGPSAKQ